MTRDNAAASTGALRAKNIVAAVSNHQDMRSLTEWHGIPFHYFPVVDGRKAQQEKRIVELFETADGELLVLARYMQILTADACACFSGRAINIHHSFLPGFKGAKAYHQAHARGVCLRTAATQSCCARSPWLPRRAIDMIGVSTSQLTTH